MARDGRTCFYDHRLNDMNPPAHTGSYNQVALNALDQVALNALDQVIDAASTRGLRLTLILARNWGPPDSKVHPGLPSAVAGGSSWALAIPPLQLTFGGHSLGRANSNSSAPLPPAPLPPHPPRPTTRAGTGSRRPTTSSPPPPPSRTTRTTSASWSTARTASTGASTKTIPQSW